MSKKVDRELEATQKLLRRIKNYNKQAGYKLDGHEVLQRERDRVRVEK